MKPTVNRVLKAAAKATVTAGVFGLLAVSSAQAQSSVQLYGQVDEWVGATKFPGQRKLPGTSAAVGCRRHTGDERQRRSRWRLQGDLHVGKFLPGAER
jgi:predicted porin